MLGCCERAEGGSGFGLRIGLTPAFPSRRGLVKETVWLERGLGICLGGLYVNRKHAVFI